MRDQHDPRADLLSIVGLLFTGFGLLCVGVLSINKRPLPDATRSFLLLALAIVLTIGGIWLTLRRQWAGMLIAAASLLVSSIYLAGIARCSDCTIGVLIANITIALMYGAPALLIIRWRRFLR